MVALDAETGALSAVLRELHRPATLLSPLLAHASAVAEDADRLGLVSHADFDVILSRHTADSLLYAIARAPVPGETWVDVGSGAGFPGMVLAICYPETVFTLVEPQRRRAGFLELQATRLGLTNVDILVERAERIERRFDVAVARALAEPGIALEALRRLAPDGTVLLAVGSDAAVPSGVDEVDVSRPGVDSPGRLLMIAAAAGGA